MVSCQDGTDCFMRVCMQGQAAWRISVTALRNSSSGVSAVRRSLLGLLDAATADASIDDDSLSEVSVHDHDGSCNCQQRSDASCAETCQHKEMLSARLSHVVCAMLKVSKAYTSFALALSCRF